MDVKPITAEVLHKIDSFLVFQQGWLLFQHMYFMSYKGKEAW
jgi:hypothetical protein